MTVDDDSFYFTAPDPDKLVPLNTEESLTVKLEDNGAPVTGEVVEFSATRGDVSPVQATTDASGLASVTITSSTAGPSLVTAQTSGGLSATRNIQFVATDPTSIIIQANQTQLSPQQETEITAILRDDKGNPVQGQKVNFNIREDESNGDLLQSIAETDALGRATVTYKAGSGSTKKDGVVITASAKGGLSDEIYLTVGGQALRVTLGTGNDIEEPNRVSYKKEWVVFVSNVNGTAVEGATVELSLLPVSYGKGFYQTDEDGDGTPDRWTASRTATCPAEDLDRDGVEDEGEDINGNGKLDPSNDATLTSSELTTDADGSAVFSIMYPQSNCSWTDFRLTATVEVPGSEGTSTKEFTLPCAASDLEDLDITPPGGVDSPYGTGTSCTDPN